LLKRYLPLLFVVFVVFLTALIFLVFRDSAAPGTRSVEIEPPPEAATTPPEATITPPEATITPAGDDALPLFEIETEEEYQAMLAALGTSTEEIEAWARTRGFPPGTYTSAPGEPLELQYRTMSAERLLELAEDGDVWAMQFLAANVGPEMPLVAVEWYRTAVVLGSAYAAYKLGFFYREVARWLAINDDEREAVLEIARREQPLAYSALAWLMIAEYEAGLPPGAMSAALTSFKARDEGIDAACERAANLLGEIHTQREIDGVELAQRKPPLAIGLPPEHIAGYCLADVFPRTDYSDCAAVRLAGELGTATAYRCR